MNFAVVSVCSSSVLRNLLSVLYLDWKQNASTNKNIFILTGNSTEKGIASILKRYYNSRAVKKTAADFRKGNALLKTVSGFVAETETVNSDVRP